MLAETGPSYRDLAARMREDHARLVGVDLATEEAKLPALVALVIGPIREFPRGRLVTESIRALARQVAEEHADRGVTFVQGGSLARWVRGGLPPRSPDHVARLGHASGICGTPRRFSSAVWL